MYQYVHGGDIYSDPALQHNKKLLDYSANINPLGIPDGVREALKRTVARCVNYPDPFCRELRVKLGQFLDLPADMIYCGNGAADVLFRIMTALRPKRTLVLAPTFADYEKAAAVAGSKMDYFVLQEEDNFNVPVSILKAITKRTEMVVLCNPNNPTGKLMNRDLLQTVLLHCESMHIPLLLDECFMDFVKDKEKYTMIDQLQEHKNLIILKAFTKTFAIPGVRLGYCLSADHALIEKLYASGQDWNVSGLAQAAGIAALDETEYLDESRRLIGEERLYLESQLRLIGLKVFEGTSNYIFVKSERNFPWAEKLKEHHILIRDCSNYRGLTEGYFRIAVKTRKDNRRLIKTMKEFVKYAIFDYIN